MTVTAPTGYAIEEVTLYDAPDDVVRPFVELAWVIEEEAVPEDPRRPFEATASRMRMRTSLGEQRRWAAWTPDRELAGQVVLGRNTQDNLHIRDMWVAVHPGHRQRGLGHALFAKALDAIGEGEGLVVQTWTNGRVPEGERFAESVGVKPGLRMRSSQLDLASIDRKLIAEWSALDPEGYRLEWVDSMETPDRLMPNVITAYHTMNTMPREGLQWEDWKTTPEIVREYERIGRERGQQRLMVLAIEDATGETAGYTEIFYDPRIPSVLHQGGTAVIPAYRGKGIGKWVKARMVERVLREMPKARYVRTENAGSNAAMLAINVGMGFKPAWEEVIWQAPVPDVRRAVESRSA